MKMALGVIFICLISGLFGESGNFSSVLEAVTNFTVQVFLRVQLLRSNGKTCLWIFRVLHPYVANLKVNIRINLVTMSH